MAPIQVFRRAQYGCSAFSAKGKPFAEPQPAVVFTQHLRRTFLRDGGGGVSASSGRVRAERSCVAPC
eukprot:14367876-Alexandrium_andersonii.AAC.1